MDLNDQFDIYEKESLNKIIRDNIDSVDELNRQFNDFLNQYRKRQRNSDDMSISLTGFTNQQRYEQQLKKLTEAAITREDIPEDAIIKAQDWEYKTGRVLIYPSDKDPHIMYNDFLAQDDLSKKESNQQSIALFGMDCTSMYMNLASGYMNIKENETDYSLGLKMLYLENQNPKDDKSKAQNKYNKNKIISKLKRNKEDKNIKWEFMYSPYFCPEEIEQMSGYYSEEVEESANKLFIEYSNYYYGYENDFNIVEWSDTLRNFQYKLEIADYSGDFRAMDKIKQSILRIGWNPEIPYNETTQLKAINRLQDIINEQYKNVSILDISEQFNSFIASDYIQEAKREKLYPISIVLVKGNSTFSNIITKVTKGEFSHSAICLDNDFNKLYSFNLNNEFNNKGGFSLESISKYPKENRLSVFTFFVNKEKWDKINENVQNLLFNIKNTAYSSANILLYPFKKINLNREDNMICSQFVDKMLKLADIDITKIDSSKVTPSYLYNVSIKNSKIYKVFDGTVRDFDFFKASKFIDSMSKKSKPFKESNILFNYCVNQYLYPVVSEARQIPIQFDDDGDMLLNNPFVNFDNEYSASHKLLLQYEKSKNLEGMKYELARLYYMNYILEKKIYNRKFLKNKDSNIKTRARILNDFNKYLKVVLAKESDFNFSKYYEESPFYANTFEVKKGTLNKIKDVISYILY